MHRKPTEHEKFCMLNMQQTLELRDKYRWPLITWFLLKGQLLDDQLWCFTNKEGTSPFYGRPVDLASGKLKFMAINEESCSLNPRPLL